MDLVCHHTLVGDRPVLQVSGEIDLATLPAFRDHLVRMVGAHGRATLVVDLDGVAALDDSGMGALLGAAGRAREQGGDLVVVCNNERLIERFALTGLDRAIRVQSRI